MSFALRPYQDECLDEVRLQWDKFWSTLVVMATGLGKTVVFSHLISRHLERVGRKALVLAHREELIRQAAGKIKSITGKAPAVEMGQERAADSPGAQTVVSSIQTLSRPSRLDGFAPGDFSLVVIDEAHHAPASTYRRVVDHFARSPGLKLLGVTATPKRADDFALGQVFCSVAYDYGLEPAIRDGWLVPVRQQFLKVDGLDFSRVRKVADDFSPGELEQILVEEAVLHRMVSPLVELASGLPTLVFCVSVKHAELVAAMLDRYKPGSAKALSGETHRDQRRAVVKEFQQGKVQYLCSCMLFVEGFDAPTTACVAMLRPTQSLVVYAQALGRGTRTWPGIVDGLLTAEERCTAIAQSPKPSLLVLDFVGNSGRHKIVSALDLLGGKYGAPARAEAQNNGAEEGGAFPVEESLERAEAEVALRTVVDAEWERRRKIKAEASWSAQEVSPFDRTQGAPAVKAKAPRGEPATDKQVGMLRYLGISEQAARAFTKSQASAVIGKKLAERGRGK